MLLLRYFSGVIVRASRQNVFELVNIGRAVIDHGGSVEYFRDAVFNYATLAEAYKVAALDGLNRIG